jgi:hypothetical protein
MPWRVSGGCIGTHKPHTLACHAFNTHAHTHTAPDEAVQHGADPDQEEPCAGGASLGFRLLPVSACVFEEECRLGGVTVYIYVCICIWCIRIGGRGWTWTACNEMRGGQTLRPTPTVWINQIHPPTRFLTWTYPIPIIRADANTQAAAAGGDGPHEDGRDAQGGHHLHRAGGLLCSREWSEAE